MSTRDDAMREVWEASFEEQIRSHAYNTAPVEALVRSVSYYLRDRYSEAQIPGLHFMELGCGAGPNLVWLAARGVKVSGVDISPTALSLARESLEHHGHAGRVERLVEGSISDMPEFADASLDGVIESCVLQHLPNEDRLAAFREIDRVVKPGGVFVGHVLAQGHTVFQDKRDAQLDDDPGSLVLDQGKSRFYLTNIGLSHFFTAEELRELLPGWSVVDPCLSQYALPASEAQRRGYPEYLQSMLIVYAIK